MPELDDLLGRVRVEASAPGRVDCGGTWDLKPLALLRESQRPTTVSLALGLRTTVVLQPFARGRVRVTSTGFAAREAPADRLPLRDPLGLVFAIVSHFDLSGLEIGIRSEIPPRSGLGGSGTTAVAVLGAVAEALRAAGLAPARTPDELALLAHDLEDGLRISYTGLEDQLTAAWGGVSRWTWCYSRRARPYEREVLLPRVEAAELGKRLLVAYTGEPRDSSAASARYVDSFLVGDRERWSRILEATVELGDALSRREWARAGACLSREADLRDEILGSGPGPPARDLRRAAAERGCGAAFAGGNRAGCLWALGEEEAIAHLGQDWTAILEVYPGSRLLPAAVAEEGLLVALH